VGRKFFLTCKDDAGDGQYGEDITMKLYLATANVQEIQEAVSLGMLDGVTTNLSLVVTEGYGPSPSKEAALAVSGVEWMMGRLWLKGKMKRANILRCKTGME
jgi:hypothetical protein